MKAKRFHVLVLDEDGDVVMHGPVTSFDVRQEYDRYGYSWGPAEYIAGPRHAQISCSHVQTGLPQHPTKPHSWKPVTSLMLECADCGYRETMIAHVIRGNQAMPACAGKPAPAFVPSKAPHTWTVLKSRDPGPGPSYTFPKPGACECGSAKAGLPTHSSWCPKGEP